jgi:enediyne biosynthesis protein E4
MRPEFLFVALLLAAPAAAQQFEPLVMPAHSYVGGWEHFVGGGVATFDCDGDALPEIYAAGGTDSARLFRNTASRGETPVFTESTPHPLALTGVTGAYPLDVDGDGLTDLAVLRVGGNGLLRGTGNCEFLPFEEIGFTPGEAWTTAFSAIWETGQTLPTLAFGNYVDRDDPNGPFEACDANDLLRPEGDRYAALLRLEPGFCALSMLFSDWGRQGRADLRVSNDRHYYVRGGQEQMWAMEGTPRRYTEADGWVKHELWGMGIASRDLTGDGRPEVFLTSMGDQRFQLNEGDAPTYRDAAYDWGLTAHRPFTGGDGRPSTGWHAAFGDVQNDGLDDLFVAKGNVEQMPDAAFDDPNNLLVQAPVGTFTERGSEAGVASMARSRGAALVDLDLDGRLDLVVVNRRAPLEAWRNVTEGTGHWLGLRLAQAGPNRDAVGAWIELRVGDRSIAREVTVGGGHAGGSLGPEHFGLGDADNAEVRVIWPDGVASDWQVLPVDGYHLLTRGDDATVSLARY